MRTYRRTPPTTTPDAPRARCSDCGVRSGRLVTYAHTGPVHVRIGSRHETRPGVELVAAGEAICPRCMDGRTLLAAAALRAYRPPLRLHHLVDQLGEVASW